MGIMVYSLLLVMQDLNQPYASVLLTHAAESCETRCYHHGDDNFS